MSKPARVIDYKQVEQLASIMCTDAEIAQVLGFTHEWIGKRKKIDEPLRAAIERGRELGKASLRRMQWEGAKAGNPTMLIWMGKQHLGQFDDPRRLEIEIIRVLDTLPDRQLRQIAGGSSTDEGT